MECTQAQIYNHVQLNMYFVVLKNVTWCENMLNLNCKNICSLLLTEICFLNHSLFLCVQLVFCSRPVFMVHTGSNSLRQL